RKGAQLARPDLLDRRGYRTEYQLHLSGKQIWHVKAAVMHWDELDSGHCHEKFAGEMNGASNAGRRHIDLTGTGFGVAYQLRDALGGKRRVDHQDKRRAGDAGDRRGIADEIEFQI